MAMDSKAPDSHIVVAVKGVLTYNRRALILHRQSNVGFGANIWEFTGGKLEFGETLEGALLREVREETGLRAKVGQILYANSLLTSPNRQIVVLNYLASADSDKVTLSEEHQNHHWATRQEIQAMVDKDILQAMDKFDVWQKLPID